MEQQQWNGSNEKNIIDIWMVIVKRIKLIAGLVLILVITAAIINFLMPKIYRGEAVLRLPTFEIATSNISAKELAEIIGKIDKEVINEKIPNTHSAITELKINPFKESKDKLQIIIESKDRTMIQPAVQEFMDFMNSIDLVKSTIREEQEKLLKRSEELSTVVAASSELIKIYGQLLKSGKLVPIGFNPVELNKRIVEIKLEKQVTEQALQRLNGGIKLVKAVEIKNKPVKPNIMGNIVLAGIAGLFLGVMLSFLMEYIEQNRKGNKLT